MTDSRVDPRPSLDEAAMLRAFLDYHRATFLTKFDGLDAGQLRQTLPPSAMTLGGMAKHIALNEDWWFSMVLLGNEYADPWRSVDWDADNDWDWHSAVDDSPEELRRLLTDAIASSDRCIEQALASGGLGGPAAKEDRVSGEPFTLRWILVHMIEEYARHNGHADLIRESIDGTVGE